MPQLTNKFKLPEPIYQAILRDPYNSGGANITVTQLIRPPRPVQLMKRHEAKLVEDISGRLWSMYGQLMHALLERALPKEQNDYLLERRLFAEVNNWRISGQFDLYERATETLFDYKFVGAYAIKLALREGRPEWEQQLNSLAFLARKNGITVKHVKIIGCARDYSERVEAEGLAPIETINFQLWSDEKAEKFVTDRVKMHQDAVALSDQELPECSKEERWATNAKNESKNCMRYCGARSVCDFALKLPKRNEPPF
jgi:hypothetical protein